MRLLVIQHVSAEGLGLFHDPLMARGWELDIRCMDMAGVSLPDNLAGYQAFIILGGPMGAYEENIYPYLYKVEELVREAATNNLPTVGICLGGQIIARALGAEVCPNPEKEIGWSHISILGEGKSSPLFLGLPDELPVFQWHGDTFSLPTGAVLLATSTVCRNQAFLYNDHIWALQFHLEVNPTMIDHWSVLYENELSEFAGTDAAAVLSRDTRERWDSMQTGREQFLANLLRLLQDQPFTPIPASEHSGQPANKE
ncbi:MAG TPA: type 1 glutamine amidotransferase [Syntrophomonas sp.]|nr:type 1 glutamine amidotransferase [Syntrophomonas sp.]